MMFEEAKTVTEIYEVARSLKMDGHDPAEVNAAATKRRKELMLEAASSSTLNKVVPKSTDVLHEPISQFMISGQDLSSTKLTVNSGGVFF